jgi:hypothetical protein
MWLRGKALDHVQGLRPARLLSKTLCQKKKKRKIRKGKEYVLIENAPM